MYILTVEDHFASAHQLRGYKGKCENLHGHNWKVVVDAQGNNLNELGLLIDFHDLKKILKSILDDLDHKNLNETTPFDTINPSSENICKYIYDKISKELKCSNYNAQLKSVTVWESATSRCMYTE
jgi:6-pyruvoyltetrahydropterin/6-carboxytetrahydropterin synthase